MHMHMHMRMRMRTYMRMHTPIHAHAMQVCLVGSTLLLGLVLQRVETVFGFTGAVASTALSYVLPAAIHWRLSPNPAACADNLGSIVLLLLGALLGLGAFANHAIETFAR